MRTKQTQKRLNKIADRNLFQARTKPVVANKVSVTKKGFDYKIRAKQTRVVLPK